MNENDIISFIQTKKQNKQISIEYLFESHYGKAMNTISQKDIGSYDEISWGNDIGNEIIKE